jgi:hypothetical protein
MNLIEKKSSNSRLIYSSLKIPKNWGPALEYVEEFIEGSHNLEFANNDIYLYFFKASQDSDFLQTDYWVGREVIGLQSERMLAEQLGIQDLSEADIFEAELGGELPSDWEVVGQIEQKCREKAQKLAPTWRIIVRSRANGRINCFFQFFKLT